jgi:hypothetical protein
VFTLFGIGLATISVGLLAGLTFPVSTGYETDGKSKGKRSCQAFPVESPAKSLGDRADVNHGAAFADRCNEALSLSSNA